MIKIENLTCGYGKKEIIKDINVRFEKNKLTVILGPNGCGKTTLLKAVAGLIRSSNGTICINGTYLTEYKSKDMAKVIAFMPQMRHVPAMTVSDFIMCARYPYLGINKQAQDKDYIAVNEAMNMVGICGLKKRALKTLSGGERQKVYFAFMLAQQTEVLLLDEPTTYLDIENQFEILDLVLALKEKNKTVAMILHDICHGLKVADNVIIMNNGVVEFFGTPKEAVDSGVLEKIYKIKIHKINIEGNVEYIIMK